MDEQDVVGPPLAPCGLGTHLFSRRLNQGSFVLLCFALFAFYELCILGLCIVCIFNLSSVSYVPT